jgi:hypothetical protein
MLWREKSAIPQDNILGALICADIYGSERESDETATFTQLSSPAELRGTDVGHRHPLGHG